MAKCPILTIFYLLQHSLKHQTITGITAALLCCCTVRLKQQLESIEELNRAGFTFQSVPRKKEVSMTQQMG